MGTVYNKLSRYLLKTMKEFIRFRGCSVRKGENFFWVKFSSFLYVVKIWYINRTVLIVVICLQTSASICKNLFFVRLLDNMFLSFGIIIYVLMWVYFGRIVYNTKNMDKMWMYTGYSWGPVGIIFLEYWLKKPLNKR